MWPEDNDFDAALRGDYAANPTADVNWGRIVAGALVLTLVALFAIGAVFLGTPA